MLQIVNKAKANVRVVLPTLKLGHIDKVRDTNARSWLIGGQTRRGYIIKYNTTHMGLDNLFDIFTPLEFT